MTTKSYRLYKISSDLAKEMTWWQTFRAVLFMLGAIYRKLEEIEGKMGGAK